VRLEGGVALPLLSPQTSQYGVGGGGLLKGGLGLRFFDAHLAVGWLGFSANGRPLGGTLLAGGGVRFKWRSDRSLLSPWLDGDALYSRTGQSNRFAFSVGAGLGVRLGQSRPVLVGPFVRYLQIIDTGEPGRIPADANLLLMGAQIEIAQPGPRKAPDRDGDTVPDSDDKCPDQKGSAKAGGCPDADDDGVPDAEDRCPNDRGSAKAGGCADADDDGVPDAEDKCPNQKGGVKAGGCADADDDGVPDAEDKCPNDRGTTKAGGCADADDDGVPDAEDKCPNQKGGAKAGGCADEDDDGVPDAEDKCPNQKGGAKAGGCADEDDDGVPDAEDRCPGSRGVASVRGCPDSDNDGIPDIEDRCPGAGGPAGAKGCPDDHDGVPDKDDHCPWIAGPKEHHGCPDSDGDGLYDDVDECPNAKGTVSTHGCPTYKGMSVTDEKVELSARIFFEYDSATLSSVSFPVLGEIARALRDRPYLRISIEGHTDSKGSAQHNNELSKARAASVRKYLIETEKISSDRLDSAGFGSTKPIDTNDTDAGRERNRRVEFRILGDESKK
jgi:outer membrane protein OmpA-like peptidoglycan-associated protein